MADFLGFLEDDIKAIEPQNLNFLNDLDTTASEDNILNLDGFFGKNDNNPVIKIPGNELGFFEEDDIDTYINKFYLFPQEIDAGFITEEATYDIQLINLFRESIDVTSIIKENFGGLILQHKTTPFEITANSEYIHELTILKDGPPFQSSKANYYQSKNPGISFELGIEGRRIIAFLYEPDFTEIENNYFRNTLKYIDNRGNEQRRSISGDRSRIEFSFSVWEDGLRAQRLRNDLRRYGNSVIAVPFFGDALHILTNPKGLTAIEIEEDLTWQYNLKNVSSFILIKNLNDDSIHEVKEIDTIDDGLGIINIVSIVANDYLPENSIVYPVMLCYADPVEVTRSTEDVLQVPFRFKEFV